MQRVGIFGGTFNPIHREHIEVAKNAIKELNLDILYIVPTKIPPHKEVVLASDIDRLNMLKLAFDGEKNVVISDFEMQNEGKSYSFITVEHFKSIHESDKLFFIVGGDMLVDFKTWKTPERITAVCDLAVFNRESFPFDYKLEQEYFKSRFNKEFIMLNYVGKEDSSTEIRVYSALGLDIADKTDEKVARYIKENNIYTDMYGAKKYEDYIKDALPLKRLTHTANVAVTALKVCKTLNVDKRKAYISAILHDVAKYKNLDDYKDFHLPDGVPTPVVHAFLGAYIAENVLGITDTEIIDAIRYHTSGKANMTTLSKLIFVADMIEKGRDYEGVDKLRELYEKDFEKCFRACLEEEVLHLKQKASYIYVETLNAYDYYINNNKN